MAARLREFRVSWILDIQWQNKALRVLKSTGGTSRPRRCEKTHFGHVSVV